MAAEIWANDTLLIVTKHQKERVIAPILENAFKVKSLVSKFDTDTLGTFTGEVERRTDPVSTARQKCLSGLALQPADLAIASEGSFGPHPTLYFVPANEEIIYFMDKKRGLEIVARSLTTDTNFLSQRVETPAELLEIAQKVGFPEHGLILRPSETALHDVVKGIVEPPFLLQTFHGLKAKYGQVVVETDMRALYNPTRLKNIEAACHKLVALLNSRCPQCDTPGFDVVAAQPGLPCDNCRRPTASTLAYVYTCAHCHYTQDQPFPHGKRFESPTFCDFCNP